MGEVISLQAQAARRDAWEALAHMIMAERD